MNAQPALGRRVEGSRLSYYRCAASPEYWGSFFDDNRLNTYYQLAERGVLGLLETPFVRHLPKEGKIIEAGCGSGRYVLALRVLGYDAEGIEWSEDLVRRILSHHPNLPVRRGNALQIDVPDGYYAGYISLGVVEHLQEGPERFMREAGRVLKTGGMALFSVPYVHPLRRAKMRLGMYRDRLKDIEFYQYAFTSEEFVSLLNKWGFNLVEMMPLDAIGGLKSEIPLLATMLDHPRWSHMSNAVLKWMLRHVPALRTCGHQMMFITRKSG